VAVDDALAVSRGVPGVELVVVGVLAHVGAVGQGGVEVAGAVGGGEEDDAVAQPGGGPVLGGVLGEQAGELAAAVGVDPDLARGAAAVALPLRRFAPEGRDGDDPVAADVELADPPVRQAGGGAAVERDRVRPSPGAPALTGGADDVHPAVGAPAAHLGGGVPPVREPLARGAVELGREGLGRALAGAGPGDAGAVRREAGIGDGCPVGGEPPRPAAGDRGDPDVVVGHEGDQVIKQVGVSQVCASCHS
jgi:hypothetical protein